MAEDATPLRLHITNRSGRVEVVARDGHPLSVDGGQVEHQPDGSIQIAGAGRGHAKLEIRCPTGSDVVVGTSSGRIDLTGRFGDVRTSTRSSRIEVEYGRNVDARSHSGGVQVETCEGECRVVVRSGSARIGRARRLEVSSLSGAIAAKSVESAQARSVSGRITLAAFGAGDLTVRSVSGKVELSVDPQRRPEARLRSISGDVKCDCASGGDGRIDVTTTSGTIRVRCR